MNTDQAYDFLKAAGVSEEISIQTVRRWLRERKIKYEGTVEKRKSEYILDNTDQAFYLLKDAGVASTIGVQVVQQWLREGKIYHSGNGDKLSGLLLEEKPLVESSLDQNRLISELKAKIKAQNEHMTGIETLHKQSINTLIKQRDQLKKEIANIENEKMELQKDTRKLLKDNLELRKEILKLRETLSKGEKKTEEKTQPITSSKLPDYRKNLGLSKTASSKEVIAGFKKLLKITHPDHGGDAAAFHFIKTDYDLFKNSGK